jgi:hypothetical protein
MNMQILNRIHSHAGGKSSAWRKWARRSALVPLALLTIAGAIGPSTAHIPLQERGGWVSCASGAKERARCHARYSGSGGTYELSATCATSSGKASQTATVYKVTSSAYRGSFYNSDYNVHGTIRVVVHGSSQSVSLSGDGASASLSLSRRYQRRWNITRFVRRRRSAADVVIADRYCRS